MVKVVTPSMEPSLRPGDFLEVDYDYYLSRPVRRFDIVLFQQSAQVPGLGTPAGKEVARIIALSGETVAIKNNRVYINNKVLSEPFETKPCPDGAIGQPCGDFGPLKIAKGEFFLLADNRAESLDSRMWTPPTVRQDKILGKVINVITDPRLPNNGLNRSVSSLRSSPPGQPCRYASSSFKSLDLSASFCCAYFPPLN